MEYAVPLSSQVMARAAEDRRRGSLLLGVAVALAVPLLSLSIAFLWDHGILALEPNGAFVQALQSIGPWEIVLGPIGIAISGRSAYVRGIGWVALFSVAVPALFVFWFLAIAYLGGLAGEPF